MAKKKSECMLPTPEMREAMLAVIRASAEPLPPDILRKQLAPDHRVTVRDLGPLLEDCVAAGLLRLYSPKTPRGKLRYWDRDAAEICRAAAIGLLVDSPEPLTAREIARRIAAQLRVTEADVAQHLEEPLQAGTLYSIPPTSAKGKARYWHRPLAEYSRLALRRLLEMKGPQPEASLRKALKGMSPEKADEYIQAGVAARELWRHPPVGSSKKELVGCAPPSPEPYLRDVGRQLTEIVSRLVAVNVSRDELRRALVQLIEAAGVPFAATGVDSERTPVGRPAAVDLLALMRRLEPGADRGALIGARDLRRASRLDKATFDRRILDLARQGELSLHRHDYVASLSPEERDELVSDGAGTYYVGVALRQKV